MARLGTVEMKHKERSTQVHAVSPPALPNQPVHGGRSGQKGGRGGCSAPAQSAMKVSRWQMWFDLLAPRVATEKIEQRPNEVILALWNQLRPDQQFIPIPRKARTREVRLAD